MYLISGMGFLRKFQQYRRLPQVLLSSGADLGNFLGRLKFFICYGSIINRRGRTFMIDSGFLDNIMGKNDFL